MTLKNWFSDWANLTLSGISAPHTETNVEFLACWAEREGGNAEFNPLNTEYRLSGSSSYNSAGVQNFPTVQEGATATVRTLLNGMYSDIVAALRSGNAERTVTYRGLATWSGGGYSSLNGIPVPHIPSPVSQPVPSENANDWSVIVSAIPTLRDGSSGPDVKRLQALLVADGHNVSIDGDFGPATDDAVRAFQRENSVPNSVKDGNGDGIVGPQTWRALLTFQG